MTRKDSLSFDVLQTLMEWQGENLQGHICFGKVLAKSAEVYYAKNFPKVTKVSIVIIY